MAQTTPEKAQTPAQTRVAQSPPTDADLERQANSVTPSETGDTHEFWKWTPDSDDFPDGVYQTALFGELVPGRVVAVRKDQVSLVKDDKAFQKSTQRAYDAQPNIRDDREARRITHEEEA